MNITFILIKEKVEEKSGIHEFIAETNKENETPIQLATKLNDNNQSQTKSLFGNQASLLGSKSNTRSLFG